MLKAETAGRRERSLPSAASWSLDLVEVSDSSSLEADWLDLQSRADCSFFQSWGWVGNWIKTLPAGAQPLLLRIRTGGRLTALAILGVRRVRRHGFVSSRQLLVSESGIDEYDALTIEHNGMLLERGLEDELLLRGLRWLQSQHVAWDEIVVSGVEQEQIQSYIQSAESTGLRGSVGVRKGYCFVDLCAVKEKGGDYLALLSRNTRAQVRRSVRRYEESGEVVVRAAKTLDEAMAFFSRLRELHQHYWNEKGMPGAFAPGFSNDFHESLIGERFAAGEVQLLEISSGSNPFGYLYNFVYRGTVCNYQSGFVYDDNPQVKPGMVSHFKAIEFNLEQDMRVYDFLAGDHRYKRSLSTEEREMGWLSLQKKRWRFRVEDQLRELRARIRAKAEKG